MIDWILKLIPAPYRVLAALIACAALITAGGVAGWNARDYFAERKELKELEQKLKVQTKTTEAWAYAAKTFQDLMKKQNARAAVLAAQRDESRSRAVRLAQQVQSYKAKLTTLEKPDVENGGMCERTAECHWLFLNAAYSGTSAPARCTGGVLDSVRGEHLPPARLATETKR